MDINNLYIVIGFLAFFLLFFLCFSIKFALIIIKMQDVIENSLDEIDKSYNSIGQVLETPVFYNSPEIKRVLDEVRSVKLVILNISSNLTNNKDEDLENQKEGVDFE